MAENKTGPTKVSVAAFIDAVPNETRRADAKVLDKMMRAITGEKPVMWGPTIVGYGRYHYRYESGREGDAPMLGFSPRGANMVLYVLTGRAEEAAFLKRLGKHKTGKSCLYINKLADVDEAVLRELSANAYAAMKAKYG